MPHSPSIRIVSRNSFFPTAYSDLLRDSTCSFDPPLKRTFSERSALAALVVLAFVLDTAHYTFRAKTTDSSHESQAKLSLERTLLTGEASHHTHVMLLRDGWNERDHFASASRIPMPADNSLFQREARP